MAININYKQSPFKSKDEFTHSTLQTFPIMVCTVPITPVIKFNLVLETLHLVGYIHF